MLSRNAERIYWLGRYIERTEDTARLLKAFSHLMLDLPQSNKPGWDTLLKIMANETQFHEHYDEPNENNVVSFLLSDVANPGSIRSSVKAARENARTLKDRLPLEGWEMLNDLNIFIKRMAEMGVRQRHRFHFLTDTVAKCQCFNGMIRTTLSRNQAYEFLCMGAFIERADMTTRTLDVAADLLLHRSEDASAFDAHIWMEILKAQNAVMMYRAVNGPQMSPKTVLRFLIGEDNFPRSIKHCLVSTGQLSQTLPRKQAFLEHINTLTLNLDTYKRQREIMSSDLRKFFDETQKGINELHQIIASTWFMNKPIPPVTNSEAEADKADIPTQSQTQIQTEI